MSGYSPVLPLSLDPSDGILLNKTYAQVAKQNLKMLLYKFKKNTIKIQ